MESRPSARIAAAVTDPTSDAVCATPRGSFTWFDLDFILDGDAFEVSSVCGQTQSMRFCLPEYEVREGSICEALVMAECLPVGGHMDELVATGIVVSARQQSLGEAAARVEHCLETHRVSNGTVVEKANY